jgi:hypothetical protein
MANTFLVAGDGGALLDARFSIDGSDVILQSRGGAKGGGAVNTDYSKALLLIVTRLTQASVPLVGAWVDSSTVQNMPLAARLILIESEGHQSPERICSLMSARMKEVRSDQSVATKGGNSTKRIRISTGFLSSSDELVEVLGGIPTDGDGRSNERLLRISAHRDRPFRHRDRRIRERDRPFR